MKVYILANYKDIPYLVYNAITFEKVLECNSWNEVISYVKKNCAKIVARRGMSEKAN